MPNNILLKLLIVPLFFIVLEAAGQTFNDIKDKVALANTNDKKLLILQQSKNEIVQYSPYQQAEYWYLLAQIQLMHHKVKSSIDSSSKGIKLYQKHNLSATTLLVNLYLDRATKSKRIHLLNFQSGCDDIQQALLFARQLNNHPELIAKSLAFHSRCVYKSSNNIKTSLEPLNEAFSISQKQQLPSEILSIIYNQAAILYAKFAIYDKAYEYNLLSYSMYKKSKKFPSVYVSLINLISNSITSGKFEQAKQHLQALHQFAIEQPNFTDTRLKYYYFSARVAQELNNWSQSISYLSKAIEELDNTEQDTYIQATYERMSFSYFRIGDLVNSNKYLAILEKRYPDKKVIVKELIVMKTLINDNSIAAINASFDLMSDERKKKNDFIRLSTANLAQAYDDNLKQLNNVLLEQRITYIIIFTMLIITILAVFSYVQLQRRNLARKEKLLTTELLKNKNQLLADVSHELRTPLTVLQIEIETLQHDFSDDIQASYKGLRTKVSDMNRLIDDISNLAKSDTGTLNFNFEAVVIKPFLVSIIAELKKQALTSDFTWHDELDISSVTLLEIDTVKFKQLLTNLMGNSLKYTNLAGKIELLAKQVDNNLVITINDSAPNVKEKNIEKIFERLYRIEASRSRDTGGSGLGLAICRSIVEAHHGTIHAKQSSLGGLTIVIKLPIKI